MSQHKDQHIPMRKAYSYPLINRKVEKNVRKLAANLKMLEDSKQVKILYMADPARIAAWGTASRSEIHVADHAWIDLRDYQVGLSTGETIQLCFSPERSAAETDAAVRAALGCDDCPRRVVLLSHNEERMLVLGSIRHPTVEGLILPAWVDVRRLIAHSSYGGECIRGVHFQILFIEDRDVFLKWIPISCGDPLPLNVLPVGWNKTARLYIGRTHWNNEWRFGWVCDDYADLFVYTQDAERSATDYQVLCLYKRSPCSSPVPCTSQEDSSQDSSREGLRLH